LIWATAIFMGAVIIRAALDASFRIIDSLAGIEPDQWNGLAKGNPTVRHEFLDALHATGCASPRTGWSAQYLTSWEGGRLEAAAPLYVKAHSYGEYVFDWAWADAYERHGIDYYPKLLGAVPFTPATGPRLLAATAPARLRLARALVDLARESKVSSLHVLFPDVDDAQALREAGMLERTGVQFHWRNAGYRDFEDFLAALSHDKRKKIRQERKRVAASGVELRRVTGREATEADWDFFTSCYRRTYREHRSTPYLTREFFGELARRMPDNVLLVIADHDARPVAAALDLFGGGALYGRYWGSVEYFPGLHFEACYYQALEFCIERGLGLFEGGGQGEHKHARGFLPETTRSFHWLAHPAFNHAVDEFLGREGAHISAYVDELNERSPFKKNGVRDNFQE
jgi:uncharacterized protein